MAKILLYDQNLSAPAPWKHVSATCLINENHGMNTVINWVKAKTAKYQGKDTLYIMSHGAPGHVLLGKDHINEDNVQDWADLRGRLHHIVILACSVVNKVQPQWSDKKKMWIKGGDGHNLCSLLAGYTKAYVTASDAEQSYSYFPLLGALTPGKWEGNVYTWSPYGGYTVWQE